MTDVMARPRVRSLDPALRKRIGSGAVLGCVVVGDVLLGGWFFAVLVSVAVALMAIEWRRLAGLAARPTGDFVLVAASAIPIAATTATTLGEPMLGLGILLAGAVCGAGIAALLRGAPIDTVAGGILYLGVPAVALVWLRAEAETGMHAVLWLLFVVWACDCCAYFAGRAIGGPRLAPTISPSKTWAGLVGGMAAATVVGGAFTGLIGGTMLIGTAIGAVLAVVAQAGDLFESWLKRRAGLKDASGLIPGHGGMLDRVDGLLFAAPVFAALILALGPGLVS